MPEILKRPTVKKGTKNQKDQEIGWDFDSKEHSREKYGNFNTPIVMKLCSRYNKAVQKRNEQSTEEVDEQKEATLNPQELAELVCKALNQRLSLEIS